MKLARNIQMPACTLPSTSRYIMNMPTRSLTQTMATSPPCYSPSSSRIRTLHTHPARRGRSLPAVVHAATSVVASGASPPRGPVVVVDNYDSFTFNLCQYLGNCGVEYIVLSNDAKTVDEIRAMNPRGILVSPGPGRPEDSGISLEIIEKLGPEGIPIFGVCMGHQCIGQVFGGAVIRAPSGVMHGKSSPVWHKNVGLVEGLDNPFNAARYHSLVIDKENCPEELEVTAWCEDGTIMAVRHKKYGNVQGVQFHPESIITDNGMKIVENFVKTLP